MPAQSKEMAPCTTSYGAGGSSLNENPVIKPKLEPDSSAKCAKKFRIMILVDVASNDFAACIDSEDVHGREPVHGEAAQASQNTVSASTDVATGGYGKAGAPRKNHVGSFVKLLIDIAEHGAGLHMIWSGAFSPPR